MYEQDSSFRIIFVMEKAVSFTDVPLWKLEHPWRMKALGFWIWGTIRSGIFESLLVSVWTKVEWEGISYTCELHMWRRESSKLIWYAAAILSKLTGFDEWQCRMHPPRRRSVHAKLCIVISSCMNCYLPDLVWEIPDEENNHLYPRFYSSRRKENYSKISTRELW